MLYDIYLQNNLVGSLEGSDTDDILKLVGQKIQSGEYTFDESIPHSVRVEPKND
jgi:hypothetical protein